MTLGDNFLIIPVPFPVHCFDDISLFEVLHKKAVEKSASEFQKKICVINARIFMRYILYIYLLIASNLIL